LKIEKEEDNEDEIKIKNLFFIDKKDFLSKKTKFNNNIVNSINNTNNNIHHKSQILEKKSEKRNNIIINF